MFRRGLAYLKTIEWAAIVGSALVLAFCLLVFVPATTHKPPAQDDYASANYDSPAPNLPKETFWERTLNDPVALYTFILAVFTVVLALSTIGLWYVTWRTFSHAEKSAERQLRAYLVVKTSFSEELAGEPRGRILVTVTITNSGQTPAYDVGGWIDKAFRNYIVPGALPTPTNQIMNGSSVLGPGVDRALQTIWDTPLNSDESALVKARKKAIFFYGRTEYRDAFGHRHYTNFRLMFRGETKIGLHHHHAGNDGD
jgi:hypothetical protein